MRANTLLFFVLLLLIGNLPAQTDFQNGYIINASGEQLNGLIVNKNEFDKNSTVTFRPAINSEALDYTPNDIMGYGFADGRFYESVLTPLDSLTTQPLFLEKALEGTLDLYSIRQSGEFRRFFVRSTDGEMYELIQEITTENRKFGGFQQRTIEITENFYVRTLRKLMDDCPSIYDRIEKTLFEYERLVNLIHDFNLCADATNAAKFTNFKQKKVKNWLLYAGVGFSAYQLNSRNTLYNGNQDSHLHPVYFGVAYAANLPNFNERMFIRFDLLAKGLNFSADFREEFLPPNENFTDYEYRLQGLTLQLQFSTVYKFSVAPATWYSRLGVVAATFAGGTNDLTILRHPNNIIGYDPPKVETALRTSGEVGFLVGLGKQFLLGKNLKGFVELSAQRTSATSESPDGSDYKFQTVMGLLKGGVWF